MTGPDHGLHAAMLQRGISRRTFIKFSAAMAAALALPATYAPRIAAAVAAAPRMPIIWLRGQSCAGDTQAFLRAYHPTTAELVLDLLSVEYLDTLMAPSGDAAGRSLTDSMKRYPHGYIAIVEGAIPLADDGAYCTIGGRPFRDIVREVSDGALATIAVGSCAFDGGSPAAAGGRTGAVGVAQVVSDARLISLPGCPLNVENLTATIVHYLTFKQFPVTDSRHRPLFAYGNLLHNQCERRAHFEFGEFVLAWGDEASQKGWCLYKMGCKGPETFANCPTAKYADGTSWPVKAGHGCVGCTMPGFWDAMSPFYRRLPSPLPLASGVTADQIGGAVVGGVAALSAAHGAASYVRERRVRTAQRGAAPALPAAEVPASSATAAIETEPTEAPAVPAAEVPPSSAPSAIETGPTEAPAVPAAEVPPSSAPSAIETGPTEAPAPTDSSASEVD